MGNNWRQESQKTNDGLWTPSDGPWTPGDGHWTSGDGLWIPEMDSGYLEMDSGYLEMDSGYLEMDSGDQYVEEKAKKLSLKNIFESSFSILKIGKISIFGRIFLF